MCILVEKFGITFHVENPTIYKHVWYFGFCKILVLTIFEEPIQICSLGHILTINIRNSLFVDYTNQMSCYWPISMSMTCQPIYVNHVPIYPCTVGKCYCGVVSWRWQLMRKFVWSRNVKSIPIYMTSKACPISQFLNIKVATLWNVYILLLTIHDNLVSEWLDTLQMALVELLEPNFSYIR